MSFASRRTSSTSTASRRARANPSPRGNENDWLGRGASLPLISETSLRIQLSASVCDGANCGDTTPHVDGDTSWSPTTTLDFPASLSPSPCVSPCASPSAFSSASPSAEGTSASHSASARPRAFPMSPSADSIPLPDAAQSFGAFDERAANGTASADVALEDWLNEVAVSLAQTPPAQFAARMPLALGRKQRQRLMRQWFRDAPDELFPPAGAFSGNPSLQPRKQPRLHSSGRKGGATGVGAIGGGASGGGASGGGASGGGASGASFEAASDFCRERGRGQHGVIWRCVHRSTGEIAACASRIRKFDIQSFAADVEAVRNEVAFMEKLKIRVSIIRDKQAAQPHRHVHVAMELCEGEPLCHYAIFCEGGDLFIWTCAYNEDVPGAMFGMCQESPESAKLINFGVVVKMAPSFAAFEVVGMAECVECDVCSAGVTLFIVLFAVASLHFYGAPQWQEEGRVVPE
ncbi:unnamed protein product [Closterium sp. Yama58-4]|nr:unnamed protein product [Closterium sp. Yama58-4]